MYLIILHLGCDWVMCSDLTRILLVSFELCKQLRWNEVLLVANK